jgi:hypothetical protein
MYEQQKEVRSGLVEIEKMGCSIDAMSPFGAASKMSQTKKSACCILSGKSGERCFVLSPTRALFRAFTHLFSCYHPPFFVLLHTQRLRFINKFK